MSEDGNTFENDGQGFDNGQGSEGNQGSTDFSIPEEYKDKGWTKFFDGKTGDDLKTELFRSYDNSQTLIGKKVEDYIKTIDLKSLDNYEEIKEALTKQIGNQIEVPEKAEDYAFNDILKKEDGSLEYEYPEDALNYFGDKFKELSLTKEQGQGLLKAYTQFEIEEFQKYTNADELETNINTMFNNNQQQRKTVEGLLKEFLPQQDQEFLQKTAPNYTIEMFYRVAKGLVDKYGFEESSSNSTNPSTMRMSEADRNAEYDRLVKQLEELDNRPQKVGEKDAIVNRMREIFK
jgi:hypothetical protein